MRDNAYIMSPDFEKYFIPKCKDLGCCAKCPHDYDCDLVSHFEYILSDLGIKV